MNKDLLKKEWLAEEEAAHIHGWDFSHINGRFEEETDLPWDYKNIVKKYLKPEDKLLDIDTGGGEFLLSLGHPCRFISATEAYPPNVLLCEKKLPKLGIDFRFAEGNGTLPFENEKFDIVINRHGAYNENEVFRVLKPNGVFVTQQVGSENDKELVELLVPCAEKVFSNHNLENASARFKQAGFRILEQAEAFRPIKFYDVGALVWFARIIEWEFIGFSVEKHLDNLYKAQNILESNDLIEGRIHRFLLVAKK